jgi:hypothetical protein
MVKKTRFLPQPSIEPRLSISHVTLPAQLFDLVTSIWSKLLLGLFKQHYQTQRFYQPFEAVVRRQDTFNLEADCGTLCQDFLFSSSPTALKLVKLQKKV